jgi:hypothetical protein
MIIAFWIVVPILMYLFVAGITAKMFQKAVIKRCGFCALNSSGEWRHKHLGRYGEKEFILSTTAHDGSPYLSIFWPIVFPFMVGQAVGDGDQRKQDKAQTQLESAQNRRTEELAEAEHQVELARLRKKENDLLDQHLKLAEIRERQQDR